MNKNMDNRIDNFGHAVEGNTKYLSHLAPIKIMVNSIGREDGSLEPVDVAEMHIGNVDGKPCLLITPEIISLP